MIRKTRKNNNNLRPTDSASPLSQSMEHNSIRQMEMNYTKRFLTLKECADYLGLTPKGVYTLCWKRKIRFYKPNGCRVYFDISDIEAYIMGGEIYELNNNKDLNFSSLTKE